MCVHVCMFVQTPLKSLDGKSTLVTILMSLAHETLLACVNNWETFVNKLISYEYTELNRFLPTGFRNTDPETEKIQLFSGSSR